MRIASCRRWAAAAPRLPVRGMAAISGAGRLGCGNPGAGSASAIHGLAGAGAPEGRGPRRAAAGIGVGVGLVLTRGAKVKSKMRLEDLPQGPVGPPTPPASTTKRRKRRAKGEVEAEAGAEAEAEAEQGKAKKKGKGRGKAKVQDEQEGEDEEARAEEEQNQEDADEEPAYPTVVQQARRNMRRFDNCVLLTRVGGFYELYFEHAEEYGPLLNLKVTQKKTSAGPVAMVCGFPVFIFLFFLKKKRGKEDVHFEQVSMCNLFHFKVFLYIM